MSFIFIFQLFIFSMAFSGTDIFFGITEPATFLRINNLLLLLLIVCGLFKFFSSPIPKARPIHLFLLAYCASLLLSVYKSDNPLSSMTTLAVCLRGLAIFFLSSFIHANSENINKVARAIIAMGVACALIALIHELSYLFSGNVLFSRPLFVHVLNFSFLRVQSFMLDSNVVGIFLGATLFLLSDSPGKRKSIHALFFLIAAALFFTFSRTVFFAMCITFLILLIRTFMNKQISFDWIRKNLSVIFLGTMLSIVTFFVFYLRSTNDYSAARRNRLFWESLNILSEQPLLGAGIGNVAPYTTYNLVPHNLFLEIASGSGFLSLVVFLLVLFQLHYESAWIRKNGAPFGLALENCFIFLFFASLFCGFMTNIYPWIIWSLIDLSYRTVDRPFRDNP